MSNIVAYINTFSNVIFGIDLLYTPATLMSVLNGNAAAANSSSFPPSFWISYFISHWTAFFSLLFWGWFAWFTFYLLVLCPFKWIRSVVTRK